MNISNVSRRLIRFNPYLLMSNEEYLTDFSCLMISEEYPDGIKGRLKFCTKSFFFDPSVNESFDYKIQRFPFDSVADAAFGKSASGDVIVLSISRLLILLKNYQWGNYAQVDKQQEIKLVLLLSSNALDIVKDLRLIIKSPRNNETLLQMLRKKYKTVTTRIQSLNSLEVDSDPILFDAQVKKVVPLITVTGRLVLTCRKIIFQPLQELFDVCSTSSASNGLESFDMSSIVNVYMRLHNLRNIGMEIYFQFNMRSSFSKSNATLISLFFAFSSEKDRHDCYTILLKYRSPNALFSSDFKNDLSRQLESVKQKWLRREISNYEYLVQLNFLSGRTRNDLSQYPIFPWILSDYTSSKLDLNNESVYRDLSKPIGALNPSRLKVVIDRYNEMCATNSAHKFMYGTHYSTPAYVSYYLVRKSPEYMLHLQNGKFDTADRLFFSIESTWKGVTGNLVSDVKELIPEFYEFPETEEQDFLVNYRNLDLGVRQNGKRIGDVLLPPWASNSRIFIEKMCEALESEYVSLRLHYWIDLIFGYKQKGEEAIKANNLFHPICTHGGDFLESLITGDGQVANIYDFDKESLEVQIREFGQIPKQLFFEPHPQRLPLGRRNSLLNENLRKNNISSKVDSATASIVLHSKEQYAPISKEYFESTLKSHIISFELKNDIECKIHRAAVTSICITKDTSDNLYNHIYAASKEGLLKLYSTKLQCATRTFNICDLSVSSVVDLEFPDDLVLLLSSWDNNIYKFSSSNTLAGFEKMMTFFDAASEIVKVDNIVGYCSWDGVIRLSKVNDTAKTFEDLFQIDIEDSILGLDIKIIQEEFFVLAYSKNSIRYFKSTDLIWTITTGSGQFTAAKILSSGLACVVLREGNMSQLKVLRKEDGIETLSFRIEGTSKIIPLGNNIVLTGDVDGRIRFWDLNNCAIARLYECFDDEVTALAYKDKLLVCGSSKGIIKILDFS